MKKVGFLILIVGVMLASCKSTKKAAQTPFEPATQQTTTTTAAPKVFSVPEAKETAPAATSDKPISVRKESISFTQPEDQTQNSFFVIIGSFSSLDNAKNFRQTLISEGFTPIILQSGTGYYRVCVDSFKNEASARQRVQQIRQGYPKYADVWLLIKE